VKLQSGFDLDCSLIEMKGATLLTPHGLREIQFSDTPKFLR